MRIKDCKKPSQSEAGPAPNRAPRCNKRNAGARKAEQAREWIDRMNSHGEVGSGYYEQQGVPGAGHLVGRDGKITSYD